MSAPILRAVLVAMIFASAVLAVADTASAHCVGPVICVPPDPTDPQFLCFENGVPVPCGNWP